MKLFILYNEKYDMWKQNIFLTKTECGNDNFGKYLLKKAF